ncbi:hypothetical protein KIPB_008382, partial [Kipferlia bialata]
VAASTVIYSGRVDALYTAAVNVIGGLGQDEAEDEEDSDDEDERKVKKPRRRRAKSEVCADPSTLQMDMSTLCPHAALPAWALSLTSVDGGSLFALPVYAAPTALVGSPTLLPSETPAAVPIHHRLPDPVDMPLFYSAPTDTTTTTTGEEGDTLEGERESEAAPSIDVDGLAALMGGLSIATPFGQDDSVLEEGEGEGEGDEYGVANDGFDGYDDYQMGDDAPMDTTMPTEGQRYIPPPLPALDVVDSAPQWLFESGKAPVKKTRKTVDSTTTKATSKRSAKAPVQIDFSAPPPSVTMLKGENTLSDAQQTALLHKHSGSGVLDTLPPSSLLFTLIHGERVAMRLRHRAEAERSAPMDDDDMIGGFDDFGDDGCYDNDGGAPSAYAPVDVLAEAEGDKGAERHENIKATFEMVLSGQDMQTQKFLRMGPGSEHKGVTPLMQINAGALKTAMQKELVDMVEEPEAEREREREREGVHGEEEEGVRFTAIQRAYPRYHTQATAANIGDVSTQLQFLTLLFLATERNLSIERHDGDYTDMCVSTGPDGYDLDE